MQRVTFSKNNYENSLTSPKSSIEAQNKSSISSKKLSKNIPFEQITSVSLPNIEKPLPLEDIHAKAKDYLSTIKDPLWKRVCQDLLDMMGPSSFFKIWKSQLGLISSQDRVLRMTCENEETADFIRHYDFIILGSIQKYFPRLKEVRVEILTSFFY